MQCEFARQFFEMLAAVTAVQKAPRTYCGGQTLYHAEIDLLKKIDENPTANVSMLSEKSGVTKSAVTQMSGKLLNKGFIEQYQDPKNKKEKYFRLTQEGQQVCREHAECNKNAAGEMCSYLSSLSERDKNTILEFMKRMTQYMPICSFLCECDQKGNTCFQTTEKEGTEESCWN